MAFISCVEEGGKKPENPKTGNSTPKIGHSMLQTPKTGNSELQTPKTGNSKLQNWDLKKQSKNSKSRSARANSLMAGICKTELPQRGPAVIYGRKPFGFNARQLNFRDASVQSRVCSIYIHGMLAKLGKKHTRCRRLITGISSARLEHCLGHQFDHACRTKFGADADVRHSQDHWDVLDVLLAICTQLAHSLHRAFGNFPGAEATSKSQLAFAHGCADAAT